MVRIIPLIVILYAQNPFQTTKLLSWKILRKSKPAPTQH